MPIEKKEFIKHGTRMKSYIFVSVFLKKNKNLAYSYNELVKELEITMGTLVNNYIPKLMKAGLISKRYKGKTVYVIHEET